LKAISRAKVNSITAFKIARILKTLEPIAASYEEVRMSKVKEYSIPIGKDNRNYQVTPENMEPYLEEMNVILEEEIEIENLHTFSLKILTTGDDKIIDVAPEHLANLMWLITE